MSSGGWVVDCGSQNCRLGRDADSVYTNDDFKVCSRSYVRNWTEAAKLFKAGFKKATNGKEEWPQLDDDFDLAQWTQEFDPVLVTEGMFNSMKNKVKSAEVFFEQIRTRAFQSQASASLALYASGRTSGCVLECGAGTTSVVPVFEGYRVLPKAVRLERGGFDLDDALCTHLLDRGYSVTMRSEEKQPSKITFQSAKLTKLVSNITDLSRSSDPLAGKMYPVRDGMGMGSESVKDVKTRSTTHRLTVKEIRHLKEFGCFVCDSANTYDTLGPARTDIRLPDGERVALGMKAWAGASEMLFRGEDETHPSLPELVSNAAKGCVDMDGTAPRIVDVVLTGGTTKLRGFKLRLAHDLAKPEFARRRAKHTQIRVSHAIKPENVELAPFTGGTLLTSLSSFSNMWVSRREWEDFGESALMRKCN
eukprot:g3410.t1